MFFFLKNFLVVISYYLWAKKNLIYVLEFDILLEKVIPIEEECKQTSSRVEQIFQMLHSKQSLLSAEIALPEKYDVTLPLETPLDLMNFEKKLRENENCRNDMVFLTTILIIHNVLFLIGNNYIIIFMR